MSKLIGIIGAKGGVGKTTLALNLGCSFTQAGRSVVIVDGDLHTPHISLYLGYMHPPRSIHDVLSCKSQLKEALYIHASGVRVIPGSISYDAITRVSYTEFGMLLTQLKEVGELILVDTSSGFGPQLDAVLKGVDAVIVVTTPDLVSQADALKSVLHAKQMGKEILGLVVNRTKSSTDLKSCAAFIGVPVLGEIPDDPLMENAVAVYHPLIFAYPEAPASKSFSLIASRLRGVYYG
ncbi:MAG: P-loop NTPase [Nanoarchaeota archaeon]